MNRSSTNPAWLLGLVVWTTSACAVAPPARPAFVPDEVRLPEDGDVVFSAGTGVTAGPQTFLLAGDIDYYLGNHLAIGPTVQLGIDDTRFLAAPTFHFKWMCPLAEAGDLSRVRPYFQGGAGFLHGERERQGRSDDKDTGVLLNGGVGVDFVARDNLYFGSRVLLNLMPSEVNGDHAFMSWEVLRIGFRF